MKENGPNSGKRPPAGADNVTIDRNSEEAVFIGERTQKVVKLRRSLRSPEENIEVPPISARPEHCGASESGVISRSSHPDFHRILCYEKYEEVTCHYIN